MSLNIPPRTEKTKKPDFKLRPGFTQDELDDFRDFLIKHGYTKGGGSFARRVILDAIGRPMSDINEDELS